MANKLDWFPFYAADWLLDPQVQAMPYEVQGVYVRLLCLQWREGSVPDDRAILARWLGLRPNRMEAIWEHLKAHFAPTGPAGQLANPRLCEIRGEQAAKYQRKSEAGAKGGSSKPQATAKQTASKSQANAKQPPSNSTDVLKQTPSNRQALEEKRGEEKENRPEGPTTAPASPSRGKTRLPDLFPVTDAMAAWVRETFPGALKALVEEQHATFTDWAKSQDARKADWGSAWRNWMRRAFDEGRLTTRREAHGKAASKPLPDYATRDLNGIAAARLRDRAGLPGWDPERFGTTPLQSRLAAYGGHREGGAPVPPEPSGDL